jgi:hypothetical protein
MNAMMTSWRPAQVRLVGAMGQQSVSYPGSPLAPARPSLIDSPFFAALMDFSIVAGAVTLAIGYAKNAETNPAAKRGNLALRNFFFVIAGLGVVKFGLDASRPV